jgi:hypothetical protein
MLVYRASVLYLLVGLALLLSVAANVEHEGSNLYEYVNWAIWLISSYLNNSCINRYFRCHLQIRP